MYRLHFTMASAVLFGLILARAANAEQQEKCTMDDKTHVAKYSCPDGYEVVYTGEGTKVCDGACFRKGNSQSLKQAVGLLVENKWGRDFLPAPNELDKASSDLLTTGKTALAIPQKGTVEFRAPKKGD